MLCSSCLELLKWIAESSSSGDGTATFTAERQIGDVEIVTCCKTCDNFTRKLQYASPGRYEQLKGLTREITYKRRSAFDFEHFDTVNDVYMITHFSCEAEIPGSPGLDMVIRCMLWQNSIVRREGEWTEAVQLLSEALAHAALRDRDYVHFHDLRGTNVDLQLVKSWMMECETHHKECRSDTPPWYPTRLVHIGSRDEEVKLVIANEMGSTPIPSYATVSHRWPLHAHQYPVLYSKNVEDFKIGIAVDKLQQSLQEAIHIARDLDVKYLWVDTLCIIQDENHPDKSNEIRMMHKVYQHGYINISATDTSDSSERLQKPRCVEHSKVADFHGFPPEHLLIDLLSTPPGTLSSRGWVLQEHFLSPRNLHIGGSEMRWECQRCFLSEALVHHGANYVQHMHKRTAMKPSATETWNGIMHEYSQRTLTNREDVLLAISGVISYLEEELSCRFLCGLLISDIGINLLWIRYSNDKEQYPCDRDYPHAPSWSWASVQGRIRSTIDFSFLYLREDGTYGINKDCCHFDFMRKDLVEVVDINSIPRTSNQIGNPESRILRLRGIAVELGIEQGPQRSLMVVKIGEQKLEGFHFQCSLDCGIETADEGELQRFFHSTHYFVPTSMDPMRVAGLVMVDNKRVGILEIIPLTFVFGKDVVYTAQRDDPALVDSNGSTKLLLDKQFRTTIPPVLEDLCKYLEEMSIFKDDDNGLGSGRGIIELH